MRILVWANRVKLKYKIRLDLSLFFGRGYLTWHRRPMRLEGWKELPAVDSLADYRDVAIVMQGPLDTRNNFTLETLRLYKHFFPGVKLFLSTWTDSSNRTLDRISTLGVQIVLSEPMENPPLGNLSRQIETTLKGIRAAEASDAKFVLKVRTDQRLYSNLAIDYLRSVIKIFPARCHPGSVKGRIIFSSSNSFIDRVQGATDFMQFGHLEDVQKFWASSLKRKLPSHLTPETIITASYLLELGWQRKDLLTTESWVRAMKEVFGFVDGSSLDFFWHKYSMREYLWRRYSGPHLDEVTNAFWLKILADYPE